MGMDMISQAIRDCMEVQIFSGNKAYQIAPHILYATKENAVLVAGVDGGGVWRQFRIDEISSTSPTRQAFKRSPKFNAQSRDYHRVILVAEC